MKYETNEELDGIKRNRELERKNQQKKYIPNNRNYEDEVT